jgi:hypothetical protein
MDAVYVAQIDQTAAALRDAYDEAGVNLYDPAIRRALQATVAYLNDVAYVVPTMLPTVLAYAAIGQCVTDMEVP